MPDTITESELAEMRKKFVAVQHPATYQEAMRFALSEVGITVVPDPIPEPEGDVIVVDADGKIDLVADRGALGAVHQRQQVRGVLGAAADGARTGEGLPVGGERMTSIEDEARARLEARIAELAETDDIDKVRRALFSVQDVRTSLAASRREPSEAATVACPHWSPGRITMRTGCTACAADAEPSNTDEREWEYGWNTGSTVSPAGTREQAEKALTVRQALGGVGTGDWGSRFMRRRPAGPWEVVPDGE